MAEWVLESITDVVTVTLTETVGEYFADLEAEVEVDTDDEAEAELETEGDAVAVIEAGDEADPVAVFSEEVLME